MSLRRLLLVAPLAWTDIHASGCVAVVPYEPNATLVSAGGRKQAEELLTSTLLRAIVPRITAVEVREDRVEFNWTETHPGPFYVPVTTAGLTQIYFGNIGRIEVYENFNVFVWGPGDSRVDKVLFTTLEDAKSFADLLMSFRAARQGASGR